MIPDITDLYRRWSTGTPRREEIMEETFILIDEDGLLNTMQKNTLYERAALRFDLGTYNSLADILYQESVEVHICKGIPERSEKLSNDYLKEAQNYWRAKLQSKYGLERAKAERAIGDIKKEHEYIKKTKLRGRYFPKRKTIELYPEGYDVEHMNDLLISTLAHEVMHAYFDRKGHSHYPYAYFVEEPLAEFGMLLYLQETRLSDILDWAKKDVASKRSCYHYGAVLYDQYMNWNPFLRRYLEEYMYNINKYEMLDVTSGETAVGLPCPISSSTGRFFFETKSKWYPKGESVYFHIAKKRMAEYDDFCIDYPHTTRVSLTFCNKTGKQIAGKGSIYVRNKDIFPIGDLIEDYKNLFGRVDGNIFEIHEVKPSAGTTPAEWIAKEL